MFKLLLLLAIFTLDISYGYKIQPRIVNGIKSNVHHYPFYVYVRSFAGRISARCGAALISDR